MQWPAIGSWQWPTESHHQSWSSYNYARSCWRTQRRPFYSHLASEANWKGEKAQSGGVSRADSKSKISSFWSVSFSHSMQQWTISQSDCDVWQVDFIWQLAMTFSVVGPRRSSKALPKAKLASKKGHGHWFTTAFWILVKPLHLRSMLSKSLRCTKNCNTCSHHWSTERAQFFSQPHMAQTNASTVQWIGLWSFASSTIFTRPLDKWLSFLQASQKLVAGKTLPNQEEAENAFQHS